MLLACIALPRLASAQTDADAIMIPKNYLCAGGMYMQSDWKSYWEGTFKRTNGNLGTVSSHTYSLMADYGITNNLNVLANIPYVTTHASAGTLEGLKGLQDLMLTVKWRAIKHNFGSNQRISFFTILNATTPMSNYQADFQPMSIGLHSQSVSLRLMGDYLWGKYFATGWGEYIRRTNITIDRTSYYTSHLIYSNQVAMPDAAQFAFSTGYRSAKWIFAGEIQNMTTLGGFDIRKNDMPFPSNRMNATWAGGFVKYTLTVPTGFEFVAGADRVITGRNMGQSTMIHGGVYYLFNLSKSK